MPEQQPPDVLVENHGSIFLFRPVTYDGRAWIQEHVTGETHWFAGALAVEPKLANDLCRGMQDDGLLVA